MSAGIDTIRVILPVPKIVRIENVTVSSGSGGGNLSVIDLGVLSAADVYAVGYIELLPAVVGRIIKGVYFLADNLALDNSSQVFFASGNDVGAMSTGTSGGSGFAVFGSQFYDTISQTINAGGAIVGDNGPLGLIPETFDGRRAGTWAADTKQAYFDQIIAAGHLWRVVTNGTTDSSEPDWASNFGGQVTDGTVVWNDQADLTTGWTATVHAIAEIVSIPGLDIPRPTSFEFVQQPTDVVAGEAFDPLIQLKVLDQNGNAFIGSEIGVLICVLGAGVFTDGQFTESSIDRTTGIATFDAGPPEMDVATPPGTYQLVAIFNGTNDFRSIDIRLVSDPFDVTAP